MAQKVLLLYGGFSTEREISISAKNDIANALKSKGYLVVEHLLNDGWEFVETLKKEKPDVVYNGLYGNWGEDGEIQGLLDFLQVPYTHSGLKTSVLGMDKALTKMMAQKVGIKIADGIQTTAKEYLLHKTSVAYPYVVKPLSDGSSVGVFIVRNESDTAKVFYPDENTEIIIEKYIDGKELTVMCLEGNAYVVTELKAGNAFYDYHAKYTKGITKHILPADIPPEVANTCCEYAKLLHNTLKCQTISRSDFMYNPQDGVVLLEINTNPGMTSLSLAPEQAKYLSISYADLCEKLVLNATYRKIKMLLPQLS